MDKTGQAFPTHEHKIVWGSDEKEAEKIIRAEQGLTIRQYFAGQALIGIMRREGLYQNRFDPKDDAKWCYEIADAMIQQGEKQ